MSSTIGDVAAGYGLAWTHRWRLLSILLPIVALTLVALLALDVFVAGDDLVIVNFRPAVRDHEGRILPWAKAAVLVAAWLLALTAGTAAVRGARPLRAALRRLPVLALGLAGVAGATLFVLLVVIPYTGATGVVALILVAGTLVAGAAVAVRVLGGPVRPFLLGGIVGPLVLLAVADRFHAAVPVLLTAVVAAQAGILARGPVSPGSVAPGPVPLGEAGGPGGSVSPGEQDGPRGSVSPGEEDGPRGSDPAGGAAAPGPVRRPWFAMVAVVVALLAPFGVAAANPVGAPTVRSHALSPGEAVAVVWPPGRHPVMATGTGARFCDNDICDRFVAHNSGPGVGDGHGSASVSADGTTVAKATLTGGRDNGGPFIDYGRCTRDGCREGWLPVRRSAKEPFGWPEMAVAVAPDQALWFVLAMPSGKSYTVTFLRCADAACAQPQRYPAGTVQRLPDDGVPDGRRARLSIGADGRPVAAIQVGPSTALVTCEPVTCAAPRTSSVLAGEPDAVWQAPAGQLAALMPGQIRIGDRLLALAGGRLAPGSGALAVSGSHVYATAAEAAVPPGPAVDGSRVYATVAQAAAPDGVHVTVARPGEPEYWQQVLWQCAETRCDRLVLDGFPSRGWREAIAAGPDGRVLIVRSDRILLVSPARRA